MFGAAMGAMALGSALRGRRGRGGTFNYVDDTPLSASMPEWQALGIKKGAGGNGFGQGMLARPPQIPQQAPNPMQGIGAGLGTAPMDPMKQAVGQRRIRIMGKGGF